jgi:hypothetical protein
MFAIVAVPFEAYQSLPTPTHRWLLLCLSRYADKAGKCWPNLRQLAEDARMSLSTVSRRMTELADLGVFHRERRGRGRYVYTIAEAYRPRWPGREKPRIAPRVSGEHQRVSQAETQEANPPKHDKGRVAFQDQGSLPIATEWTPRLRSWRQSRFWLPAWGPRPDQPGCFVPAAILQTA